MSEAGAEVRARRGMFWREPLDERRRRNGWHMVALWAAVVVATVVFPGSPADGWIFCPFRAVTGYSCPGCGMTRSFTEAMRGELYHSLEYHPLGLILLGWLTIAALWRLVENVRGERIGMGGDRWARFSALGIRALFVFVLLFGGGRLVLEIAGILTPV